MKIYDVFSNSNKNLFSILKEYDSFYYCNGHFFLCSEKLLDDIKYNLINYDVCINEIDGNNFKKIQNKLAQKWCYEKLFENKLVAFENSEEGQYRIELISKYLDAIEKSHRKEVMNIGKTEAGTDNSTRSRTRKPTPDNGF